jgi:hypothetical protein
MKTTAATCLSLLFLAMAVPPGADAQTQSSSSSSSSQSVTVTSDGTRTVKKTVTTIDGVTTTTTEVTDAGGKVTTTTTGGGPKPPAGQPAGDGAWMGVRFKEASPELRDQLGLAPDTGVVAEVVAADGPAAKAGLQERDLLLSLDGQPVGSPDASRTVLQGKKPGDTVEVVYLRRGQRETAQVELARRPPAGDPDTALSDAERMLERLKKDGTIPPGLNPFGVKIPAIAGASGAGAIEEMLKDPNVPAEMKKQLEEMLKQVRAAEGARDKKSR